MAYYVIKLLLSAALIVIISEVSKQSSFIGGLLASIPMVSFLAIIWLYIDTKDVSQIADLSTNIFWLVIPSLIFFIAFPMLLKTKMAFWPAFGSATVMMLAGYGLLILLLRQFNVSLWS